MSAAKSYSISKLTVWEAFQRVKANRGAAGIDEQSIAQFEQKLQRNLYKVWNRMSSGSYFPPPVRQVEIPKQSGGKRKLGIPTVADRVAQTAVKCPRIEPAACWKMESLIQGSGGRLRLRLNSPKRLTLLVR